MKLVALLGFLSSILIAGLAIIFLRPLFEQRAPTEVTQKPKTVVVAADPLKYGDRLTLNKVKVVEWFAETLPQGSVGTVEELTITEDGPYVLASIPSGSPILKPQLTAPGQKPSLSALLDPGTVAVTVPVTTITGVAGFVLPDERVDIFSTRQIRDATTGEMRKINDVILQDIKVLAADRVIDADPGKPVLAKSVTFQVPRQDAQKLILATQEGEVFLTLRSTDRSADEDLEAKAKKALEETNQQKAQELEREAAEKSKKDLGVAQKQPPLTDNIANLERIFSDRTNVKLMTVFRTRIASGNSSSSGESSIIPSYYECISTRCIDVESPSFVKSGQK